MGQPAVNAVAEIIRSITIGENIKRRKRGSVTHRLGIVVDHTPGGSGCSLLDGRIHLDLIEWNTAHLHFGVVSFIHGQNFLGAVAATASSRVRLDSSILIVRLDIKARAGHKLSESG